jgi:hypothetical protein
VEIAAATPELGEVDAQCRAQSRTLLESIENGRLEIVPAELGARLQAAFPFTEAAWQAIERFAATTGDGAGLREVNLLMGGVGMGPPLLGAFVERLRERPALQSVELFFGHASTGSVDLSRLPSSMAQLRVNSVEGLLLKVPKGLRVLPSDGPSSATALQYMEGPVAASEPVAVHALPTDLAPAWAPPPADSPPQPLLKEVLHHRLDPLFARTSEGRGPLPAPQADELGDLLCNRVIHAGALGLSDGKHDFVSLAGRKLATHPAEGRPAQYGVKSSVFGHLLSTGDRLRLTQLVRFFARLDAHSARRLKARLCQECAHDAASIFGQARKIAPADADRQLAAFQECAALLDTDEIVKAALDRDPRFAAAIYAGTVADAGAGVAEPAAASAAQRAQARTLVRDRGVRVRDIRQALKKSHFDDSSKRWLLKMLLIEKRARLPVATLRGAPVDVRSPGDIEASLLSRLRDVQNGTRQHDGFDEFLASVPPRLHTPRLCIQAVRWRWRNLKYVRKDLRDAEMCLIAVKRNGAALAFVPRSFRTKEVCVAAFNAPEVGSTPKPLAEYVPRSLRGDADVRLAWQGFHGVNGEGIRYACAGTFGESKEGHMLVLVITDKEVPRCPRAPLAEKDLPGRYRRKGRFGYLMAPEEFESFKRSKS